MKVWLCYPLSRKMTSDLSKQSGVRKFGLNVKIFVKGVRTRLTSLCRFTRWKRIDCLTYRILFFFSLGLLLTR